MYDVAKYSRWIPLISSAISGPYCRRLQSFRKSDMFCSSDFSRYGAAFHASFMAQSVDNGTGRMSLTLTRKNSVAPARAKRPT
jgi:hypothetical protein